MTTRAGLPDSVFHQIFPNVSDCYRAAFEQGLDRLSETVSDAAAREQTWLERVRSGLVALLGFFDDEPSWARLLVLDTPLDVALTFECRRRLHGLLAGLIDRSDQDPPGHRATGRAAESPLLLATLTGEMVVGGVLSVIRTSVLGEDEGKMVELAPSLMAFIVAPCLGHAGAQAELEGRPSSGARASVSQPETQRARAISRTAALPIRATRRTTLVLRAIARAPYSSNREVAQAAGLTDEGQTSKLLARLERQGVIENVGIGAARGEPNAWLLTPAGRRAVELLGASFTDGAPQRRGARVRGTA
ncbi:MAG TPA: winged helix-turn-helix domain-containing protein [Solirubrobacteraceae bacterium]|nr:winged helix-turn-helix domain-containing protein [Solirubrobacteraceae bacterium]